MIWPLSYPLMGGGEGLCGLIAKKILQTPFKGNETRNARIAWSERHADMPTPIQTINHMEKFMQVFPKLASTKTDGGIVRALMLADCSPGDLIFMPREIGTRPCIVIVDPARQHNAVIELQPDSAVMKRVDPFSQAVKLETDAEILLGDPIVLLNQDTAKPGSIVVNERGTGLVFLVGDVAERQHRHAFDLSTNTIRPIGAEGFEFRSWSIRLRAAPEGSPALYTFANQIIAS